MRRQILFTAVLAVLPVCTSAAQGDFLNHPRCPTRDTTVTWIQYMTEQVPRVGSSLLGNQTTVEFTYAKQLNERTSIGNLDTRHCYNIFWQPENRFGRPRGWDSQRNTTGITYGPDERRGLPGDPRQYQINVHGVIVHFNDAGEVFDSKGRVVGKLSCYRSIHRCREY
jgi:hypothetical protein